MVPMLLFRIWRSTLVRGYPSSGVKVTTAVLFALLPRTAQLHDPVEDSAKET